jgi:hypothetical protein
MKNSYNRGQRMKKQFSLFILRWILNSFGLWVAVRVFGTGYSDAELTANTWACLVAGLIF